MADGVQLRLEASLPDLRDAEKKSIYSKSEIRFIVQRRTKFEYALRARQPSVDSFVNYIDFEWELHNLFQKRVRGQKQSYRAAATKGECIDGVEGAGPKKYRATRADFAHQKNIALIYDRAHSRFPGNVDLWLRSLDDCVRLKALRRFPKVLARGLRAVPREPALWIRAAKWEFNHNVNAAAARALMRHARTLLNGDAEKLRQIYVAWFALEVKYTAKIITRIALAERIASSVKTTDPIDSDLGTVAENSAEDKLDEHNIDEDEGERPRITDEEAKKAAGDDPLLNFNIAIAICDEAIADKTATGSVISELLCEMLDHSLPEAGTKSLIARLLERLRALGTAESLVVAETKSVMYEVAENAVRFGTSKVAPQHLVDALVALVQRRKKLNISENERKLIPAKVLGYLASELQRSYDEIEWATSSVGQAVHKIIENQLKEPEKQIDRSILYVALAFPLVSILSDRQKARLVSVASTVVKNGIGSVEDQTLVRLARDADSKSFDETVVRVGSSSAGSDNFAWMQTELARLETQSQKRSWKLQSNAAIALVKRMAQSEAKLSASVEAKVQLLSRIISLLPEGERRSFPSKFLSHYAVMDTSELIEPLMQCVSGSGLSAQRSLLDQCVRRAPHDCNAWAKYLTFELHNARDPVAASAIYMRARSTVPRVAEIQAIWERVAQ